MCSLLGFYLLVYIAIDLLVLFFQELAACLGTNSQNKRKFHPLTGCLLTSSDSSIPICLSALTPSRTHANPLGMVKNQIISIWFDIFMLIIEREHTTNQYRTVTHHDSSALRYNPGDMGEIGHTTLHSCPFTAFCIAKSRTLPLFDPSRFPVLHQKKKTQPTTNMNLHRTRYQSMKAHEINHDTIWV